MATYRRSIIVRIDTTPACLIWSGIGDLNIPADSIVPADDTAIGGDTLLNFPDFQQLIGGTAERLEFTVSGIDAESARLAVADAAEVPGARVDVGTIYFDDDWQIESVSWDAQFEARSLAVSRPQMHNGKTVRSITLTIVQGSTTRALAPNAYFTDADQRRHSATDAIFTFVGKINAGTSRRFGPSD